MAVVLFGGNENIILDGVEVDAKVGEFHSFSATPTNFAIEDAAMSTDHIVEQPDTLEVSFVLTNLDEDGSSYGNRAAVALDALRRRLKARQLYQVVTRHRLYPSMAVTGLKAENTSPFSGSLRGRISFQEVNRARLDRVKLPAALVPRKPTAASQTDAGRVDAKEPTPADKKNTKQSTLSQLFSKGKTAAKSAAGV